jgi:predicted DNA binding CopG/RHH family protein
MDENLQHVLNDMESPEMEQQTEAAPRHECHNSIDHRIDVLNLPPRKEVHNKKNKRIKVKISSPLIRFIFVILLLSVLILVYYLNSGGF